MVSGDRCGSYATLGSVFVAEDDSRVAVVLANGMVNKAANRPDLRAGTTIMKAARRLFCAA